MITNSKIVSKDTNPADYFAQKPGSFGTPEFVMSSSALKSFGQCPSRFKAGYLPPDSDSKTNGSLIDCLVLTPSMFADRYIMPPATYPALVKGKAVVKPWNWNADHCKEWREVHGVGKEVVRQKDLDEAKVAVARLAQDPIMARFIDESDKQVYVTGEWHDKETGLVIPVRIMLDLVPRKESEFYQCLGDLKTCANASLVPFQRNAFKFGYHVQAALYRDVYQDATGEDRNTYCFLLQENYPPFETGKRILTQDFQDIGKATYTRLLANYCQCLKTGKWPGYDDTDESIQGWGMCAPEPWMAENAAMMPQFGFEEEAPESQYQPTESDIIP